jgi:PKD repeat protein
MDTLTAGQEKITPQDKEEKIAEPSAVVMAKPSAVKNDKAAHKDSTNDSAASIPVKENIEKKSAPVNRETEYLKYQDGFRTVVPKIDYSKKNPPKEKVIIKQIEIDDSAATEEIINNALPGKNKIKGETEKIEPAASASATEGCPPLEVRFKCETDSEYPVWWTFGDTGSSAERNPDRIFDNEGEYYVKMKQTKKDGSDINSSLLILVYPKPEAVFEIVQDNEAKSKEDISFVNHSVNSVSYKWDFDDGTSSDLFEPTHKFRKAGTYNIKLIVTSDYGCTDSLTVAKSITKRR